MFDIRCNMDKFGKILIPIQIRKELNLRPGDTFIVKVINDEMHIINLQKVLQETRALIKAKLSPGQSLTEDFIRMRKQEADLENNMVSKND